jgi:hypothetical protein
VSIATRDAPLRAVVPLGTGGWQQLAGGLGSHVLPLDRSRQASLTLTESEEGMGTGGNTKARLLVLNPGREASLGRPAVESWVRSNGVAQDHSGEPPLDRSNQSIWPTIQGLPSGQGREPGAGSQARQWVSDALGPLVVNSSDCGLPFISHPRPLSPRATRLATDPRTQCLVLAAGLSRRSEIHAQAMQLLKLPG